MKNIPTAYIIMACVLIVGYIGCIIYLAYRRYKHGDGWLDRYMPRMEGEEEGPEPPKCRPGDNWRGDNELA